MWAPGRANQEASSVRRPKVLTCFIRYEIDPFKRAEFERYSRVWGEAIPRCGADLIG